MDKVLQSQLLALEEEIRAAAVPNDYKQTAVWCLKQLPPLYAQFRRSNESRYIDEITRLVQGMLTELTKSTNTSPEALRLAASITERIRLLHEQFGLPGLNLKTSPVSPSRPRKAVLPHAKK